MYVKTKHVYWKIFEEFRNFELNFEKLKNTVFNF